MSVPALLFLLVCPKYTVPANIYNIEAWSYYHFPPLKNPYRCLKGCYLFAAEAEFGDMRSLSKSPVKKTSRSHPENVMFIRNLAPSHIFGKVSIPESRLSQKYRYNTCLVLKATWQASNGGTSGTKICIVILQKEINRSCKKCTSDDDLKFFKLIGMRQLQFFEKVDVEFANPLRGSSR